MYICRINFFSLNMKKCDFEDYMGYKVKPKGNSIQLYFDADSFKEYILNSYNAGMSLSTYVSLLSKPCSSCGNDKVQIELIKKDVRKTANGHGTIHLFAFENTEITSQVDTTDLVLQATLAFTLQIEKLSTIYTSKTTHRYREDKNIATLVVFKNSIRTHTINCIIKDKKLYANEAV